MTNEELSAEVKSCLEEIEFWAVDLKSDDDDYVADARRFINIITKRLKAIQAEMNRRKEVIE